MTDKTPSQKTPEQDKKINEAYKQAEKDIDTDPESHTKPEPGDDLDEGELARLEAEN